METQEEIADRHRAEEGENLRAVLRARGWLLSDTAAALGIGVSSLQRLLARHPDVDAERRTQGGSPQLAAARRRTG